MNATTFRRSLSCLLLLAIASNATNLPAQPAIAGNPGHDAQGEHGYAITHNTAAITLMPELKNAPAPAWIKPGTRIIIDKLDGTISPDPNRRGAGHGFDQIDVLAVMPDAVVVTLSSHLINPLDNTHVLTAISGLVTTPGCVSDAWITPDVLHKYMDLNGNGVTSTKIDYQAAGKNYHAISQTVTGNNSVTTTIRDIETGLLLHSSTEITNGADRINAQATLLGVRDIKTPWAQGQLPQVLQNLHQLTYEGAQDTLMPGVPGMRSPLQLVVKVTGRGPGFLQLERTGVLQIGNFRNDLGKTPLVTSMATLTPLAIAPPDLAKLRQGQVLDTDPISNIVTSVTFMGRAQTGKNAVVITQAAPGPNQQRIDFMYDAESGILSGTSQTYPAMHQITRTSLTAKE